MPLHSPLRCRRSCRPVSEGRSLLNRYLRPEEQILAEAGPPTAPPTAPCTRRAGLHRAGVPPRPARVEASTGAAPHGGAGPRSGRGGPAAGRRPGRAARAGPRSGGAGAPLPMPRRPGRGGERSGFSQLVCLVCCMPARGRLGGGSMRLAPSIHPASQPDSQPAAPLRNSKTAGCPGPLQRAPLHVGCNMPTQPSRPPAGFPARAGPAALSHAA